MTKYEITYVCVCVRSTCPAPRALLDTHLTPLFQKGRTPKDMAEARGEYDVVNYFEEVGGHHGGCCALPTLTQQSPLPQIRIALLVKDQRALNKEEVAKMQADKEALAIREARFAHETAQDKVKNAVEEYHK